MNPGSAQARPHVPGLDLLRCLAILSVFVFHYSLSSGVSWVHELGRYGWAGVDLFFVLSGFLIGGQVFGQLARQRFGFGQFYLRRGFRILPSFWAVLVLYLVFPVLIERSYLPPLWRFLTFTQNFGLNLGQGAAFSHAWSLCVEEHFYLLFPLIAWGLTRRGSQRLSVGFVAALLVAGVLSRSWAWECFVRPVVEPALQGDWGRVFMERIYYPTYQRLDGLVIGAALAALSVYRPGVWSRLEGRRGLFLALGLTSLLWVAWAERAKPGLPATALGYPLIAASFGCLLVACVSPESGINRARIPGIQAGAALSYAFYLIHKQAIHLTRLFGERHGYAREGLAIFGASFLLSVLFALALHGAVEKPFMRWRARLIPG